MVELATRLVERLGGVANLTMFEPCLNRVRVKVADPSLVDVAGLKAMGAYGVVMSGWVVQVVICADTEELSREVERLMAQDAPEPAAALAS
jgi:PTS system N-acetylglucosamine-specific IIB component